MRKDDDGAPRCCINSGRCLGARPGIDIEFDDALYVEARSEGMSVAPDDPMNLDEHRRPPELQGSGKDPVWEIDDEDLGDGLLYRPDPRQPERHGFIEPAKRMKFEQYQGLLCGLRRRWREVPGLISVTRPEDERASAGELRDGSAVPEAGAEPTGGSSLSS
jgi:hypothetical protein